MVSSDANAPAVQASFDSVDHLNSRESSPDALSSVAGTSWEVQRLGDQAAPRAHLPTAIVTFGINGSVGGMLSCNGIGGRAKWTADGGFSHLTEPLISTLMECGDEATESHAFATRFWRKMGSAKSWKLIDGALEIQFSDGSSAWLKQFRSLPK